jgi:predicted nucleic-acid-binding protein
MIAIDTNVLLRYLLFDDEVQSKKAAKLIDSSQSIYISHVVLVETIWTLKGKKYKLTPEQIDRTISALFEDSSIVMQDDDLVWRALIDYRTHAVAGSKKLDFSDALIGHLGRGAAEQYGEQFGGFYTFDVNARSALKFAKTP